MTTTGQAAMGYNDWQNFLRGSNTETLRMLREQKKQSIEQYQGMVANLENQALDIDQEIERRKRDERTNLHKAD